MCVCVCVCVLACLRACVCVDLLYRVILTFEGKTINSIGFLIIRMYIYLAIKFHSEIIEEECVNYNTGSFQEKHTLDLSLC